MSLLENPLETRYASKEMLEIFAPQNKYKSWRKIWLYLARSEQKVGLPITNLQLQELEAHLDTVDLEKVASIEKELRHDVMSHIKAYALDCPSAGKIIHLGATSAFVTDNAEYLMFSSALNLVKHKLLNLIDTLSKKSLEYKDLAILGKTHLQSAQPTTLGKRMSVWLYDFYQDFLSLNHFINYFPARGIKGTVGTQSSFLELVKDPKRVLELEKYFQEELGAKNIAFVTGQTLSRKIDVKLVESLASIGQSVMKMANDIRILQSYQEIEEPFRKNQVGSSAMPYKRNPVLCERMTGLARHLQSMQHSAMMTYSAQFLERTLDDSSPRRMYLVDSFLLIDAVLILAEYVISGLNVNKEIIASHLNENLPFFASENILMKAVEKGADRQVYHEKIRQNAMDTVLKNRLGEKQNLLEILEKDKDFDFLSKEDWNKLKDIKQYIGMAPYQVQNFIQEEINPLLNKYKNNTTQIEEPRF